MEKKINLKDLTLKEMEVFFENIGEKKFRAKQVFGWLYKGVNSFEEMSNISKDLRAKLEEKTTVGSLKILTVQESAVDGTKKYLFGLEDGNSIESVFMKYKHGNSICISSQAGCRMGCKFCASTLRGLERNLSAGEIIGQIVEVERHTGEKISNVVVMGTGEPFDNYDNLSKFLNLANSKDGLNLGMRSFTVSTCGIVPKIKQFAEDFPQVNLAISLHAPNDEIRNLNMPINKSYPIDVLLEACREYTKSGNRRITFEYALVAGLNDREKDAVELAKRLKGMLCHVNLITLNSVDESGMKGSSRQHAQNFKALLEKQGIPTTVRRELGSDIDAACGQLRLKNYEN